MATVDVRVPDIGDFDNVPVIEIQVKEGDEVKTDDPLITLESDKAAMDVPAPRGGKIAEILVHVGDKVSEGSPILKLDVAGESQPEADGASKRPQPQEPETPSQPRRSEPESGNGSAAAVPTDFSGVHASPSVRMTARELDIDLTKVKGTGDKGRITKEDVKRYVGQGGAAEAGSTFGIPEIPSEDFARFGPVETRPMSRLKKRAGPHLHRAWLNIPHVTNSDEADITSLEEYRKELDDAAKLKGFRVTIVAFLLKAAVSALKAYPEFNASIAPGKDALILKRYYNIGVAVDTPDGLVVPVIRDVDRKGILELSQGLSATSARMREGRITPTDIQGGTFSVSSLGGIGGTNFTPIVNAPEVAILGAMRAVMKPVWDGAVFQPRLMLPLCVSYDHRAVDGALASRFLRKLCSGLADVRQLVL